ncbi:AraC family transcriptional regulator [Erwinia sp. JUb26]|uniref:AraC family transcriptional regulator n=1 Tax=Erwinia sp. JUb26 TaxID=2485126 RepID=UPI000F498605|nr:AraC family transcriptional regulator [Erwinia sp. JUb26]ROR07898.1 AraC-like protein [Erwinia sp. JUb26]
MTRLVRKMSEITLPVAPTEGYFGLSRYGAGETHGPRVQRGIQFIAMLSGSVTIEIDERPQVLQPGMLALLLPGEREFFRFDPAVSSEHIWCQLDFAALPGDFNRDLQHLPSTIVFDNQVEQLMELGMSLAAQPAGAARALVSLAETLLYYYASRGDGPHGDTLETMPKGVREACRYIAMRYQHPLALEDIAARAHCSVNHLIALFRRHLHQTPARYLRDVRLRHAGRQLIHSELPVALIAEQCGFVSPFHFSRAFKEHYGLAPLAFRRQSQTL